MKDMVVTLNGEERHISGIVTVEELLGHLGLDPRAVVVEVNRQIVRREQVNTTALTNGDSIELVHFVGGG